MMLRSTLLALLAATSLSAIAENQRSADTIFNDYCFSCHGTGWENAPVIGDSFAWEERAEKGIDALLKTTIQGINGMPAKGACADCSEAELRAVIEMLIE